MSKHHCTSHRTRAARDQGALSGEKWLPPPLPSFMPSLQDLAPTLPSSVLLILSRRPGADLQRLSRSKRLHHRKFCQVRANPCTHVSPAYWRRGHNPAEFGPHSSLLVSGVFTHHCVVSSSVNARSSASHFARTPQPRLPLSCLVQPCPASLAVQRGNPVTPMIIPTGKSYCETTRFGAENIGEPATATRRLSTLRAPLPFNRSSHSSLLYVLLAVHGPSQRKSLCCDATRGTQATLIMHTLSHEKSIAAKCS